MARPLTRPQTQAQPQAEPMQHGQHRRGLPIAKVAGVAVALVIIYLVASAVLGGSGAVNISAPTTLNITNSTKLFTLQGSEYAAYLVYANGSTAQVAISRVPVLLNPVMYVSLYLANSTNVNGNGQWTNMGITLVKGETGAAEVLISPVLELQYVSPSADRIRYAQTLLASGQGSPATGGQGSGVPTSTVAASSSTSTAASTSATTTASQSSGPSNSTLALDALEKDVYYPLMQNYTELYAGVNSCSPTLYNNTYLVKYGHAPSGINTYWNESDIVPYSMNLSFARSSGPEWTATYSTASHSGLFTGKAIIVALNITSATITNTTVVLSGIFGGSNYSQIYSGYTDAKNIGNACGVLITSCESPC